MEQAPERQLEQPERNLRDNPMPTIEAMAEVEGPAWLAEQERLGKGGVSGGEWDTSLPHALEFVQSGRRHGRAVVYGHGGLNRWHVELDGSVSFSESLAQSPEYVERARALGFAVVP